MFDAMNAKLKDILDRQIAGLEVRIEQTLASDDELARTADILRSVPGIGPVANTMLIAVPLWFADCKPLPGSGCPSLANSRVSRPPRLQAWFRSHMTVVPCTAGAPSEATADCYGT
ncbi:hypothetical protein [Phaeobacter sp. J2-8]|uniref:hypothetical protein n=1 Tax=Phaeobacter sp. J2-8 TaxID=2931394 RepID=UPI001FD4A484|nr:hypothetical protein [Phaeobacter sp. J2-8]MCJ7873881.1 hypothetical protein [Phaeobacter sp. J2-8]